MSALLSPCLGVPGDPCGKPAPRGGCPRHRRARERAHHNPAYDRPEWRLFRGRILAAHRARFGDWCPGADGHAGHVSHDLTVDHDVRLVDGGPLIPRAPRVMCRSLNGSLGARLTR